MSQPSPPETQQTYLVYSGDDLIVTEGSAEGDPMTFADELLLDDTYQLHRSAQRQRLTLGFQDDPRQFRVSADSAAGVAGQEVILDSALTLMARDGTTFHALIFVALADGGVDEVFVLPLARLDPHHDVRLIGIDRAGAATRLAEVACVAFVRGTQIMMASGDQRPIEDLRAGEKVLTRDDGPQQIRWIGETTVRATGDFAPVLIRKGALHNAEDLILSPDHRLFIYQRQDHLGTGRAEVLVRARHLIDDESVVQLKGGHVDYFQLLFDTHQIIFAEGIAAESLLLDPRTRAALPGSVTADSQTSPPHLTFEVPAEKLAMPDPAAVLRKACSAQKR